MNPIDSVLTIIRLGMEIHLERLRGMTGEQREKYYERIDKFETFWQKVLERVIKIFERDGGQSVDVGEAMRLADVSGNQIDGS